MNEAVDEALQKSGEFSAEISASGTGIDSSDQGQLSSGAAAAVNEAVDAVLGAEEGEFTAEISASGTGIDSSDQSELSAGAEAAVNEAVNAALGTEAGEFTAEITASGSGIDAGDEAKLGSAGDVIDQAISEQLGGGGAAEQFTAEITASGSGISAGDQDTLEQGAAAKVDEALENAGLTAPGRFTAEITATGGGIDSDEDQAKLDTNAEDIINNAIDATGLQPSASASGVCDGTETVSLSCDGVEKEIVMSDLVDGTLPLVVGESLPIPAFQFNFGAREHIRHIFPSSTLLF